MQFRNFCCKMRFNGFIIFQLSVAMTTIPAIERIEKSQCKTCSQNCTRLCVTCGYAFCNKHLLSHSGECNNGYQKIIRTILRDDVKNGLMNVLEVVLRSL